VHNGEKGVRFAGMNRSLFAELTGRGARKENAQGWVSDRAKGKASYGGSV